MKAFCAFLIFGIVISILPTGAKPSLTDLNPLSALVNTSLKDMEAKVEFTQANQVELSKINRDFAMAYRLKDVTLRYKDPDKMRMDSSIGQLIFNGTTRLFKVPTIRLTKKDDLGDSPGKRYSLLDLGILTAAGLTGTDSKFEKIEVINGISTQKFAFNFRGDENNKYQLWLNPETHLVVKRVWQDGQGNLKATFLYLAPKQISTGIWTPGKIEVQNREGSTAAASIYSEVKVNQGLDDSLFRIP